MSPSLLESFWGEPNVPPELSLREWENFLGQARQTQLLSRIAVHFQGRSWLAQLPDGPRSHIDGALWLPDRQQHEVRWEVDCISHALHDLLLPVVLLKGAAYLMARLPPAAGRLFSDIDLMVPREHIAQVEGALFAAGWISDERDPYNQRYYRQWMHEVPPLRHVRRNTYIDLHHTITPPTSRFNVDGQKLLARIEPLAGYAGLYVLAPEDMILHSAVHWFTEGDFSHGLRDLLDLNDLLVFFETRVEFWDQLLERADELGLQIPLFHTLHQVHRLFGTVVPPRHAERILGMAPHRISRLLMVWMLGLVLRPMHPSCETKRTKLARWLLYVRSHVLRMPLYLVVPHLIRKTWMRHFSAEKS